MEPEESMKETDTETPADEEQTDEIGGGFVNEDNLDQHIDASYMAYSLSYLKAMETLRQLIENEGFKPLDILMLRACCTNLALGSLRMSFDEIEHDDNRLRFAAASVMVKHRQIMELDPPETGVNPKFKMTPIDDDMLAKLRKGMVVLANSLANSLSSTPDLGKALLEAIEQSIRQKAQARASEGAEGESSNG